MRWLPVLSMMLVSMISYIDRNTLALLAPTILRDTHLSAEQYGFIISAFSVAYMLGNPIWGRILDRVGLRVGMTAAVSLWTLASVSHAFATGFQIFAAARGALGFGEGATFPGGLRTVMQTLPPVHRGLRTGSVSHRFCALSSRALSQRRAAQIADRDWTGVVDSSARLGDRLLLLGLDHGPLHARRRIDPGRAAALLLADVAEPPA